VGRFAFFSLFYPLYTRLKKDKILENFTRGRIYGHIESHPGIHYSELLRDLKLGNGNLAYHLKTLEREKMIRAVREGQMKLFYPKNGTAHSTMQRFDPLVRRSDQRISGTRKSILNLISATPGLSEIEIAQWLGLSKQNTYYHLRHLEQKGIIRVEREGGNARCFIVQLKNGDDGTPKTVNGNGGSETIDADRPVETISGEDGGGNGYAADTNDEFKPNGPS